MTHFDKIIEQSFVPTAINEYGDVRHTGVYLRDNYTNKAGDKFETWLLKSTGSFEAIESKRVLRLTLHRKWFDKIACGRKTHEFRLVKPYWTSRLHNREYDFIEFRNGYHPDSPVLVAVFEGVSEHTVKGVKTYAIHIGKIGSIQNYKNPLT